MTTLNHVAVLVRSLDRAAKVLASHGCQIGPKEEWDGEGTAEIYVGEKNQGAKLLLLEPIKPGAYMRAMEKRGPGLHHVAIDVIDLEGFVAGLAGTGWYLHPKSLRTIRESKTAWLARPGTGLLIEVQSCEDLKGAPPFISRLDLPLSAKEQGMISALGIKSIKPSEDARTWLEIARERIALEDIFS